MLSEFKALDAKYRNSHPGAVLVSIERVAIPAADVHFDLLVDEIKPIPTPIEYVLRFISLGVSRQSEIAEALGLPDKMAVDVMARCLEEGLIAPVGKDDNFGLTVRGKDALTTLTAQSPRRIGPKLVVDKTTWSLVDWPVSELLTQKQLNSEGFTGQLIAPAYGKTFKTQDFTAIEIDKALKSQTQRRASSVNVLQVISSKARFHGYVLGWLLIKVDEDNKPVVVIEVCGERRIELEDAFYEQGLHSKFNFEGFRSNDASAAIQSEVRTAEATTSSNETFSEPDGGMLETYEHAALFEEALQIASKRLVIVSPWISDRVVNANFLARLERLVLAKVDVRIAWHFDDGRDKERPKDSARALKALLALSRRHENFKLITLEQSHAKVLIFDDMYVASSFNWLSFSGSRVGAYRLEYGEYRDDPRVVQQRFDRVTRDFGLLGHPTGEHDIPQEYLPSRGKGHPRR